MKTREELEKELARIQSELKALDDCGFDIGEKYYYLLADGAFGDDNWKGDSFDYNFGDIHRTIQQAIINKGISAKQTLKLTITDGVPTVEVVK